MPINDKPKAGKPVLIKKNTAKKTDEDPPKLEATVVNVASESKSEIVVAKVAKKEPAVAENKVVVSKAIEPTTKPIANVVGKLSVVVKMTQMPKQYKKLENNINEFTIDMQTMELVIRTPLKMFMKFFRARREALQWVANIEGKVSQLTDTQIIVEDAKIFVANKELKTPDVAETIAEQLRERSYPAAVLIKKIIQYLGIETINDLVKEAKEIFFADGLWSEDEQRKRTLGGVFFFLVKQKIPRKDWLAMSKPKANKPSDTPPEQNTTP